MNTIYNKNIDSIISYFDVPKTCTSCLGLELEHFPVYGDESPAPYFGDRGVLEVLNGLKPYFEDLYYVDGALLGMYNDEYSISLEPSAQFEISVTPKTTVREIEKIYSGFQNLVAPILKKNGLRLETLGYRPKGSVYDLELIPKKRYEYMDRYFKTSGTCGINMMRGTASTQVSIDFVNEWDFVRKYRFAYLIMPAIKLICDNTPVFEDKKNDTPLKRTYIWRNTDKARCEAPSGVFEKGFGFASYAEYLMNVPLIFIMENGTAKYVGDQTAAQLFENKLLAKEDIEHITSMVFPDVRLKRYIEIRGADSLPIELALGYTALIKALFYSCGTIESYLDEYKIHYSHILAAENSLMKNGKSGKIYGVPADEFIKSLFACARNNISGGELHYIETLEEFYNSRNEGK
jgi:glutamate--cysteine ligase